MGECLTPIPVKLRAETVAELDAMRAQLPLLPGRSTVARGLLEEVFLLIAEGILQFRSARGNRLLGVSGIPSVSGIPVEFPAHIAAPIAGPKPLVRVPSKASANRRRISGLSQMGGLVEMGAWVPPFLGRMRPFKSNSFRQVA